MRPEGWRRERGLLRPLSLVAEGDENLHFTISGAPSIWRSAKPGKCGKVHAASAWPQARRQAPLCGLAPAFVVQSFVAVVKGKFRGSLQKSTFLWVHPFRSEIYWVVRSFTPGSYPVTRTVTDSGSPGPQGQMHPGAREWG